MNYKQAISQVRDRIRVLQERSASVVASIEAHKREIAPIEEELEARGYEPTIEGLRKAIKDLEERVSKSLEELNSKCDDLDKMVSHYESVIEEVHGDKG